MSLFQKKSLFFSAKTFSFALLLSCLHISASVAGADFFLKSYDAQDFFKYIDSDNDHKISIKEMRRPIKFLTPAKSSQVDKGAAAIFQIFDGDQDGLLDNTEFDAFYTRVQTVALAVAAKDLTPQQAFTVGDINRNNLLEPKEIGNILLATQILTNTKTARKLQKEGRILDMNGDKSLSYGELEPYLKKLVKKVSDLKF